MNRCVPKNVEEVIENNLLVFSSQYLDKIKYCKQEELWENTIKLRKKYAKRIVNIVRTFKEKK